ncbi:uncharacterized protein [Primulina huaijiensis]|uniref:uncharacterized protein n=1 Tax=Primulina huaijiensis TaxID=1492673 RepID=UPI003CC70E64
MSSLMWVLKLLVMVTFFDLSSSQSETPPACSPADRAALLGFKAGILKDTTGIMPTWAGSDCCGGGWEGVECDPMTGRVIRLMLQRPPSDDIFMKGILSPSLSNLRFLEMMVISGMRRITGTIPEGFSNLTRLTQLILDDNSLKGNIPATLGHLPLLQTLSLSGNLFTGLIPTTFGNLKRLQQLNLAKNLLTGSVPLSLSLLQGLESLDFSFNSLSGSIPDFLGNLRNLTYLVLTGNRFSGQIPISLCNLNKLSELSIDQNLLSGRIPAQIGKLKSVSVMKLSSNKLTGQIPESISHLGNLWNLNLSRNLLTNPLPTAALSEGLPSLLSIDLSYSGLNLGTIPDWIRNRELSEIHLAGCKLQGALPNFTKTESLTTIDLSDNYFTSGISNFSTKMTGLQALKISNNLLKADLSSITFPSQISVLNLHSNQLFGSLSGILNNKTGKFMEYVDVSGNQISGSIPEISGGLDIKLLNVANNKIAGHIPSSISNLNKITRFDISRNKITGTIPTSLGLLLKIQWLDLSINNLTGKIPDSLLGIEALRHASFRANRLCGEIPQGRPFNIFPAVAYAHNLCLCGKPLTPCRGRN